MEYDGNRVKQMSPFAEELNPDPLKIDRQGITEMSNRSRIFLERHYD